MPTLVNHMSSLDTPRSLRGRSKLCLNGGAKHSPDGYFAHDELFRNWRPSSTFNGPDISNIRRRSKDQIFGPDGEPPLQDVQEEEGTANAAHPWHRPTRYDSRSPCPALNVAANHGYLPRDGRDLTMWTIIKSLRECYNVSWVLAVLFTVGSFIILRIGGVGKGWLRPTIDLDDLSIHGVLEHNSSLTHVDMDESELHSPPRSRSVSSASSTAISASHTPSRFSLSSLFSILYRKPCHRRVPIRPSRTLIRALFADSASGTHLTLQDVARARIRRNASARPIQSHLKQFADSELTLTLGIFSSDTRNPKVKLEVLREWLEDERLPRGWKPTHEQGFWQNHLNTAKVQQMMAGLQKYRAKARDVRTVLFE